MVDLQPSTGSGRKLFYGLFVFPLLIAVGMAVLLCTVVLLTREVETPESLITDIKTGAPSKRWQKAFELSNELNRDPAMLRSQGVMREVIHILTDSREYDEKTRSYMAIALSRFSEEEARQALLGALEKEESPEVQLYLMWALGQQDVDEARVLIEGFLPRENEALRKMAAYVLGALGNEESVPALTPLLNDNARDVRWNAALSLARLGNASGAEVLIKMTDREFLASQEDLPPEKIEEVMVNAIRGLALLQQEAVLPILEKVSKEDPSLRVRQAAFEALGVLKKENP